ncbi:MAG: YbdK family carboxylate-amine ligase [Phycisphaerales bacterium]|nr:YbdK family carboxylate-amine ligase [Phycisphaerales bacterium]
MPLQFNSSSEHTLGVEIELGVVDRDTCDLVPRARDILDKVPQDWQEFVKPEFMQGYLEFNTSVCKTVDEVRADLQSKLEWGYEVAAESNATFLWSGTHPFARWDSQVLSPDERYQWLMDTMQLVARRIVCFGLHVHVGVDSGDKAIQMCDRLMRHLPVMLALSANSPCWCGNDTGLSSYRSKIMESLPTAGMPETMRNWSEYNWLIDHLQSTDFIHSSREIWWDVRPVARFGTVEVRIMDTPLSMRHLLGLVAMTQCVIAGISSEIDRGAYLTDCHPMIARQNKWHAVRYGLDATLVDPDTMLAASARQMARRTLELCRPVADRLGCATELGYCEEILQQGTGAQMQRRLLSKTESMVDMTAKMLEMTGSPWMGDSGVACRS